MKKILFILFAGFLLVSNYSYAQLGGTLGKITKDGVNAANSVKSNGITTLLRNMDTQLKNQFKLDGVKSQILGDVLNIKMADTDFAKLSSVARSKQGLQAIEAAKNNLAGGGINLKGMGIKTVVVDMVRNMSVTDIIQSVKSTL